MNVQTKGNGKEQFLAFLGYDSKNRAVRKSLGVDKDKAYGELAKINKLIAERQFKEAANVFDVAVDLEVKAALKKLEGYGVTLTQAVDFYLEHHRPTAGHLTVEEASKIFLGNLERLGRAEAYIRAYRKTYLPHLCAVVGKKRLIDVTQDDAEHFIYRTKKAISSTTKGEYIGKLRTFFNTMAELGYYQKDLNPFEKLKKPQASREEIQVTEKDRCLGLSESNAFLSYLVTEKIWDVLAVHIAVMFCGCRMDEIKRLNWTTIDLARRHIDLTAQAAKKRRRRVLVIPENAFHWFRLAFDGMGGVWKMRSENAFALKMNRIKNALRKKKETEEGWGQYPFNFHQNFARVTFASHSYAMYGAEATAAAMGHTKGVDVLHTNYKEIVSKEVAEKYFGILPPHLEKKKRDKVKSKRKEWETLYKDSGMSYQEFLREYDRLMGEGV